MMELFINNFLRIEYDNKQLLNRIKIFSLQNHKKKKTTLYQFINLLFYEMIIFA